MNFQQQLSEYIETGEPSIIIEQYLRLQVISNFVCALFFLFALILLIIGFTLIVKKFPYREDSPIIPMAFLVSLFAGTIFFLIFCCSSWATIKAFIAPQVVALEKLNNEKACYSSN